MDDVVVQVATSHHILVKNVHPGGNKGNDGTRGLLYHGGGSGGDGGGLQYEGDDEGEAPATGENERGRHQKGNGHHVPNVHGSVDGHFAEVR